ncbi:hypothetical protein ACLOJK_015472 [Asimina triloba]
MSAIPKWLNIFDEIVLLQRMFQERSTRVPHGIPINSDWNPSNRTWSKLMPLNLSVLLSDAIENEEESDVLSASSSEDGFKDALDILSDPLEATTTDEAFELPTLLSLRGQNDLLKFSNGNPSSWIVRMEEILEQHRVPSQIQTNGVWVVRVFLFSDGGGTGDDGFEYSGNDIHRAMFNTSSGPVLEKNYGSIEKEQNRDENCSHPRRARPRSEKPYVTNMVLSPMVYTEAAICPKLILVI